MQWADLVEQDFLALIYQGINCGEGTLRHHGVADLGAEGRHVVVIGVVRMSEKGVDVAGHT